MLKRLVFSLILSAGLMLYSTSANAQFSPGSGFSQFNFGLDAGYNFGVYAGMDFGVSEMITLGPRVGLLFEPNYIGDQGLATRMHIVPTFRVDYHYSGHIDALPDQLDLYGGLSAGINLGLGAYDEPNLLPVIIVQAGARWYFSDRMGAHVEIKQGPNFGGSYRTNFSSIGLSLKL